MNARRSCYRDRPRRKRASCDPAATSPFVETVDGGDSSEEESDPDRRRSLIDEFRKLHRLSIPLRHQLSERSCRKLSKQHGARLLPVEKLADILVILGESEQGADKTVTAQGGELRIEKPKINNQFSICGPPFWRI